MLKLYTDLDHTRINNRTYQPVDMLRPLLSISNSANEGVERYMSRYAEIAPTLFTLVDRIEDADLAVLPLRLGRYEALNAMLMVESFAAKARTANVPWLLFHPTDSATPVQTDGHVFRCSLHTKDVTPTVHAYTGAYTEVIGEFLDAPLPTRKKSARPSVGFCGQVPNYKAIRTAASDLLARGMNRIGLQHLSAPFHSSHIRGYTMRALKETAGIDTQFIIRSTFTEIREDGNAERRRLQQEYMANIADTDYTLCMRGHGNFSLRFYETLAAGRIPLFINTGCVLPYEPFVNWKEYMVWVEHHEIPHAGEKLLEFHHRLSADDFVDLQRECRRLFDEWVSMHGFFANFYRHFTR